MNLIRPTPEQLTLLRKLNNENTTTNPLTFFSVPFLDARTLLNFLRRSKFSLEQTKKRLDTYFTVKNAFPEFFTKRDITLPELQRIYEIWSFAVLPILTPQGRRVTVVMYRGRNFQMEDTVNFCKIVLMMTDIRAQEEEGVHDILVVDAAPVQLKNLGNVSLVAVKRFLFCALEGLPVRVKEFHVINASPLVGLVVKWASRFVKDKVIRRVQIHDSLESLHECLPKKFLPEEIGGTAGKLEDFMQQCWVTLEEHVEWFKEQEKFKSDESKRVGKEAPCGSNFGPEGSFRQLSID
ncbi:alpha-tocopherol transfer protein-like [Zophobas morio]|uniref:alpha-tocopherol transfer protein-like n=1 Tax=Zophobas morio TaxID=2755281 RepID=UPI0030833B59